MTLMTNSRKKGFTLLELLIVITILAILTLVVVLFINPVEILKKSRDVQRMSDLSTMKTAIALHLQDKSSNSLGGTATTGGVANCSAVNSTLLGDAASTKIRISLGNGATAGTKVATNPALENYTATTTAAVFNNDGSGWIPFINFSTFTGGAPVEKIPADPTNTATTGGTPGVDSLYYRYQCKTNNTFELDATLESATYGVAGTDSKTNTDGGNSGMRFEVGTDLNILPSTAPIF